MVDTVLASWQHAIGAGTKSAAFGTDPYAAASLNLRIRSALQAFPGVEQTSADGRDVTGAGEEGGAPKLLATRGAWPWEVPRARVEEIAWLLGFSLGDVTTVDAEADESGSIASAELKLHTIIPDTTSGAANRFSAETRQHTAVSRRYLDAFLNSITLRMNTGASNRTINASGELVFPSAGLAIPQVSNMDVPAPGDPDTPEMDAGSVEIRIKQGEPSTTLVSNWRAASRANRGDLVLDGSDTALTASPTDLEARTDYWEYTHSLNVDIDGLYGFNTGLYMSQPVRGQRSHAYEIGIPYEDDTYFDAARTTDPFAVEMIVRQEFTETVGGTAYTVARGIHMVIPFAFLSGAPELYAKGPQEFQRLNFAPKVSGSLPSIQYDVFVQNLDTLAA